MVERQPIGHTATAIMARNREAVEAKPRHDGRHVLGHCTFRIWRVIRTGGRTGAAPISAKIGADHGEVLCEQRRNVPPHQMRLGKAVQQEKRRTRAGPAYENSRFLRLHIGGLEILDPHGTSPSER